MSDENPTPPAPPVPSASAPSTPSTAAPAAGSVQVSAVGLAVATGITGLILGLLGGFLLGGAVSGSTPSSSTPSGQAQPAPTNPDAPAPAPSEPAFPTPLETAPKIDFTGIDVPAGVTEAGAYPLSTSSTGPFVEIYEDLRCPACAQFNQSQGAAVTAAVENDTASVQVYLTAYQDSREITNAAACVYNANPANFWTFVKDAYAATADPAFNSKDPKALVKLATTAGAEKSAVQGCIESGQFNAFVDQVSAVAAGQRQISGTPSVLVDGVYSPDWTSLSAALQ